jgi:hypothetical protein
MGTPPQVMVTVTVTVTIDTPIQGLNAPLPVKQNFRAVNKN